MERLLQDLRFGFRTLYKNFSFTFMAVITLALGIGGNSAIFTVINAVLLRPLPYEEANRLVWIQGTNLSRGFNQTPFSVPDFIDYREQNQVFEDLLGYWSENFNLTEGGEPELIQCAMVTSSFFSVLKGKMAIGRGFLPEEALADSNRVAVISHRLWQHRYGSDPDILGRTIKLNDGSFIVIGVTDTTFRSPNLGDELWIPMILDGSDMLRRPSALQADQMNNRKRRFLAVVGRLKPDVSIERSQLEMASLANRLEQQYPDTNSGWSVNLVPLHEQVVGDVRTSLLIILGAVTFVLLIACVNVANLLLARAAGRSKEISIRTALGATRVRLIRQLLTESILLALLGGALGLLLSYWGVNLLVAVSPENIPRVNEISIDERVLGFTLVISIITGIIFGLTPTLQTSKPNLNDILKEGGRSSAGGARQRVRSLLVVSEVALALVLLIGAGLLIKSFYYLREIDPGFKSDNVLTMQIALPQSKYAEDHKKVAFFQQVSQQLQTLPGVQSVGATTILPLSGESAIFRFTIEGRPAAFAGEVLTAHYRAISPNYFGTMGIPLLNGRDFTEGDSDQSQGAVIINKTMMQRYWPNEDPIGKRIVVGIGSSSPREIVGVVEDVKHSALDTESGAEMYVPYLQTPWPAMYLAVRTTFNPNIMANPIRSKIMSLDRDQSIARTRTLEQLVSNSVSQRRLSMLLLLVFAGIALVLAAIGIYSVLAYSVILRTHEIGVRMALGAQPSHVIKLILGQGVSLAGIGVAIGLATAFILTRIMSSLLYGVSATDPIIFVVISAMLISVALIASYIPARRATKIDPMEALKYE